MVRGVYSTSRLLFHGALGGVIGGVAFAAANMLADLLQGYPFYETFRLLGSILMPVAVGGEASAAQSVTTGLLLHFVISVVYGIVFVYVATLAGRIATPGSMLFLFAVFYGMLIWLINFLIIAPIVFPELTGPGGLSPAGFTLAHAFYGLGLGIYLAVSGPRAASGGAVRDARRLG